MCIHKDTHPIALAISWSGAAWDWGTGWIYIYIYIHIYIRRPLQSVERVRLHLLAYNIRAFPIPNPQSKAQQRTLAQAARQLTSKNSTLRAPRLPGC